MAGLELLAAGRRYRLPPRGNDRQEPVGGEHSVKHIKPARCHNLSVNHSRRLKTAQAAKAAEK